MKEERKKNLLILQGEGTGGNRQTPKVEKRKTKRTKMNWGGGEGKEWGYTDVTTLQVVERGVILGLELNL